MAPPPTCGELHPRHRFYACTLLVGHDGPHKAMGAEDILAQWPSDASLPHDPLERRVLQLEQAILELAAALREAGINPARPGSLPSHVELPAPPSADDGSTISA